MADTPEFPLADEFHFLALQCEGQANGPHRASDRGFLERLVASLFEITGEFSLRFSSQLIAEASAEQASLPVILRQAGAILRLIATRLDQEGRAA